MLAEPRLCGFTGRLQLGIQDIGHQRKTTAATGACLRAGLDLPDRRQTALTNREVDGFLRDVVARADLRLVSEGAWSRRSGSAQNKLRWGVGQRGLRPGCG